MSLKTKKLFLNFLLCGILFIFLFGGVSAYSRTTTNGALYSGVGGLSSFTSSFSNSGLDPELCSAGTDFILQIQPFDCTPAPVRSDLLEDGDVAVYCKIGATQINPLIDVKAIKNIYITGKYPREVKTFGYLPAQAALGYSDLDDTLNNPILDNLGYAMIILRQNSNESSMPDYVVGNLSARITYDVENAFGVGGAEFYLPVLSDEEFSDRINQYSFWEGRGFLRAESVDDGVASISIYSGNSVSTGYSSSTGRTYTPNKYSERTISEGEKSGEIYLPGFSPCLASFQLRLNEVTEADTRAKLKINSDYYEITKGSTFLDEKCQVKTLEKDGLNQKVGIICKEDDGRNSFNLMISPGVELNFDGDTKSYTAGDFLYQQTDADKKSVYLAYVGSKGDTTELEDLFVVLVALPQYSPEGLSDDDVSSLGNMMDQVYSGIQKDSSPVEVLSQGFGNLFGNTVRFVKWVVKGEDTQAVPFTDVSISPTINFKGKTVSLRGYSEGSNNDLVEVYNETYTLQKTTSNFVDNYKILKDGTDTGLYLSSGSALESPKFYLYKTVTGVGTPLKLAVFNPNNGCTDKSKCTEYSLYQKSLNANEADEDFFGRVVSGKIYINENRLYMKKINFTSDVSADYKKNYENAINDFETVVNSYSSETEDETSSESYGEKALYEAIKLSYTVGQIKTVNELCQEFEQSYPDSIKVLEICKDDYQLSNNGISTRDVFINGKNKLISFEGISEPTYKEYGAEITVKGPNGKTQVYELKKEKTVYLDVLKADETVVEEVYVRTEAGTNQITYFKFSNGKWVWSFDKITWFDVSKTKADSGAYNGVDLSLVNIQIVSNLKTYTELQGKSFLTSEGAVSTGTSSTTDNSQEYIRLVSVDEDSARVEIHVNRRSIFNKLSDTYTLNMDNSENYGSEYLFTLTDTNIENVARVSVIPNIDYKESNSSFSFKIGIEKRAIQLSDDQIQTRIDSLNNSINDLTFISDKLKSFNKAMGTTCLATGAILTVKNFIANSDGKSIARQKVMRDKGGWTDICNEKVSKGEYSSLDECYLKNADAIDKQVNEMNNVMQQQDTKIKTIESSPTVTKSNLLSNTVVNQSAFMQQYSVSASGSLDSLPASVLDSTGKVKDPNGKGGAINLTGMKKLLDYTSWKEGNAYTYEDLRDIELYANLVQKNPDDEFYKERLYSLLSGVQNNAKEFEAQRSFSEDSGLKSSAIMNLNGKKSIDVPVDEYETFDSSNYAKYIFGKDPELSYDVYVYAIIDSVTSDEYLIAYGKNGNVINTYKIWANELELYRGKITPNGPDEIIKNPFSLRFVKYDKGNYENEYKNAEIKYYEGEPYKGYPAVVPLDTKDGWYAATKPKLGVGSSIASYSESGRVESFWLCNVGPNGLEEFSSSGFGDDICEQVNLGTGQPYNQFYGLTSNEAGSLVSQATDAIEKAQRAYKNGVSRVRINGVNYKVGSPAVSTPAVQCQDYMSPKECKLLFNVCDPVVCPSSRCDLGGNYPVQDVVQSGVIGSIALCFPNYKEGIYVPVCTTGVQAGIDSWISVQKSYRDCLQENLNTGATIGICDEIHSVYACEFFWKQALPLTKVAIPKIISAIAGENTRGGGEYLGVQSAWQNAQDSLSYFKQSYAAEAFNAFKIRSVDEAGGAVCKNFASIVYPSGADFVDSLVTPRSPPQFTGRFDEISLSTATNPPTSHYKVYYHIYAGQDSGVYYQVYLQGGSGSSYYQDTAANRVVASDYATVGDYASETVDFTAPSGYSKLCIVVNGQEECDFKEVSTSFAQNYVNDLYLQEQSTTKVTTENGCVSGTASLYSFLNPNGESALNSLIDPALYSQGIIRICATKSPGAGTDAKDGKEGSRWRDVGYCSDTNVRCWIDTNSVKNAIRAVNVENQVLNDTAQSLLDSLTASGDYINNEQYSSKLNEIKGEGDNTNKITLINNIIDKVFFSNQRAELFLLRGLAYGSLAESEYGKLERTGSEVTTGELDIYGDVPSDIKIYTFDDGQTKPVYYRFNKKWQWSLDKVNWEDTSSSDGVSLINQQIIMGLNGKSEADGISLIEFEQSTLGGMVKGGCDSSVGAKVLSVAKDKIGQDTTRIENGNQVYDHVCATFVSNVLIDAGVLPQFENCPIESVPERDAVVELNNLFAKQTGFKEIDKSQWATELKSGDVVIWGCKGTGCTVNTGEEFQHITIFESYDGSGAKIVHDGGMTVKISEKTYPNIFGDTWYVTHVWRAGCGLSGTTLTQPTSLTSNSPVYEISFRDAGFAQMNYKDLDLVFASNAWYWKLTQSSTTSTNYFALYSSTSSNWIETNLDIISKDYSKSDVYNNLDTQSKRFIRDLYGLNYVQGLPELIDFAVSEGTVLKTGKVYFPKSSNEQYFVYKRDNGDKVYFRYIPDSKSWLVQPLGLDRDVNWIKVDDYSGTKEGSNYVLKEGLGVKYRGSLEDFNSFNNLIEGLKNKDYENGIIYLFSQNSNFGKINLYSSDKASVGDLDSAITYVKDKINSKGISDLSILVRELRDSGVLNSGEAGFILGEDKNNLQNFPEDADYILNFLIFKKGLSTFCTDIDSTQCYIDYINKNFGETERYTTFLENRIFVDYVYINGFIDSDQYNSMLPSTAGQMLYNIGRALGGSPEKGKTMGELKTMLESKGIVSLCGYPISYNENTNFLNFLSENGLSMSDVNCNFVYAENNHIVQFYVDGKKISNLNSLVKLTYLKDLRLTNAGITDVSKLGSLTNLEVLYLTGNKISDATFIDGLKNLESLNLANNNLKNLDFIFNKDYMNAVIMMNTFDISQNCIPKNSVDFSRIEKNYARSFSYAFNPRSDC